MYFIRRKINSTFLIIGNNCNQLRFNATRLSLRTNITKWHWCVTTNATCSIAIYNVFRWIAFSLLYMETYFGY